VDAVAVPPLVAPGVDGRGTVRVQTRGRRIVFVNRFFYPDISATSQILTDLARRLQHLGFEIHVVCSRLRYQSPADRLPAEETIDGIRVHRVWSTGFGRSSLTARALDYLSFYPTAMFRLARVLRRDDIVVAKTDPPLLSVVVGPVARLRSARVVNWLQDVFPEIVGRVYAARLPQRVLDLLLRLRDRSLRRASMNVVLGSGMREYLRRREVPETQLRIVENWAASEPGVPQAAKASRLRAGLGLGDKFVIGYSGNLGRAHDHATILRAASRLRDDPDVVFLMIGGGSGMSELEERARAEGLTNLKFLPYRPREELVDSLAAADVHLVTLLPDVEGLMVPSKLYGVMAAGRPTVFIGDASGEVARILRKADCGATVPCGDPGRLVAELMRVKTDPELRARLGANAARAYRQNYTFDVAADRWVELLQRVGA
jgi:glycosyltransferase involved in cell wall biosynthesis